MDMFPERLIDTGRKLGWQKQTRDKEKSSYMLTNANLIRDNISDTFQPIPSRHVQESLKKHRGRAQTLN